LKIEKIQKEEELEAVNIYPIPHPNPIKKILNINNK